MTINRSRLELRTLDDQYEPDKCRANTEAFVKDDVFALFGYVGTPTSLAAVPVANQNKVPFFGPFTGAEALRDPFSRYVFHVRASYYDETVQRLKVAKCANASCSSKTLSVVDDPPNAVGLFTSIAIGADGFPVISYWDRTAAVLKVAKCSNASCTGGSESVTAIDSCDVSELGAWWNTSIAVGPDGFPVISYWKIF